MKMYAVILGLGLIATVAGADTADIDAQYFHPAASLYIQGDSGGASNLVANGLSVFPDDAKLLRLKELLEQQQEQEQDQQNQDDQQQNDDQQQSEDQQQSDQQQDQDNQDQQESPPEEQPPQEQESQPTEPQSAEQMTPEEARQLLDSMRQEEENKRLQLHPVLGAPVKVDKDW